MDSIVKSIALSQISPSKHQARKAFDEEGIKGLAESMRQEGLIQPVTVRSVGLQLSADSPQYELISGERRLRAAKLLGWDAIEAKVIQTTSEAEAAAKGLVENIQREDLNPIEEAEGLKDLAQLDPNYWTQEKIASVIGEPRIYVTKSLSLLDLPDTVKDYVRQRTLSREHGIELLRINNANSQKSMANKAVKGQWSVKQLRLAIDALSTKNPSPSSHTPPPAPAWDPMAPVWSMAYEKLSDKAPKWDVSYGQTEGGLAWRFWVVAPGPEPRERVALWFKMMAEVVSGFSQDDLDAHAKFKPAKVVEPRLPVTPAEVEELTKLQEIGPEAVYEWMYGKGSTVAKDLAGKTWKDLSFYTPELKPKK